MRRNTPRLLVTKPGARAARARIVAAEAIFANELLSGIGVRGRHDATETHALGEQVMGPCSRTSPRVRRLNFRFAGPSGRVLFGSAFRTSSHKGLAGRKGW